MRWKIGVVIIARTDSILIVVFVKWACIIFNVFKIMAHGKKKS